MATANRDVAADGCVVGRLYSTWTGDQARIEAYPPVTNPGPQRTTENLPTSAGRPVILRKQWAVRVSINVRYQ
ncbi:hypothetical protein EVAR_5835_1 [Eumeta japonica]|uniref:Uncharacterized protein n=1 Tax=Eumeta variegata TaxID=151549 RepID=A0A4C1TEW4_EUMVA|nr:hypothetical protein EVAR_5835_1 [Eumeta japonica]